MNRVVAFLGPLFALAAGGAAAWLGQHFPGVEVQTGTAAATIAAAIEFAAGAGVAGALQYRWLRGWQRWEGASGTPPQAGASVHVDRALVAAPDSLVGSGTGAGTIVEPVEVDDPGTHADAGPDAARDAEVVAHPEDEPRAERPVTLDDPFAPAR